MQNVNGGIPQFEEDVSEHHGEIFLRHGQQHINRAEQQSDQGRDQPKARIFSRTEFGFDIRNLKGANVEQRDGCDQITDGHSHSQGARCGEIRA